MSAALSAPYVLEYTYRRSTGEVIGRFLTGLRDGQVFGVRGRGGRVIVPPTEYDPETGEAVTDFVEVGPGAVVETWAWVGEPRATHPLDRPFAFALLRLDGADTPMLHVVDAGEESAMKTGMRVTVKWAEERVGAITDIASFVPGDEVVEPAAGPDAPPITRIETPVRLDYTVHAGTHYARYLGGFTEGRILGATCPSCDKVYVPPRGSCPECGVPHGEPEPVADEGTLCSFCIIRIPFEGQRLKPPYVFGSILLDGADLPFFHLVSGVELEQIHMGMRVRAKWSDELGPTVESIDYFEPNGEPDAAYDSFKEHL